MTENHKPALVAIGKAIRGLREERGMSVEALATAAQTSVGKLEAIEDGRTISASMFRPTGRGPGHQARGHHGSRRKSDS